MSTFEHRVLDGKYRLVRQLVEGGMGSVWFAEHLSLHSPVAVKLIGKEIAETEEGLQRFLREARTAASIRSPHVVQILDYGVDLGTPYIVMELLDGESLADRLKRVGSLTPSETERVIRQVSRAVGRAHNAGIVHRDLKPANIFIIDNEDEEVVKLLDFGIAKASSDAFSASIASNTRTGSFLGTPFYVSPEQAEGVKSVDHRTDIWAMGVIAFECLLGHLPFKGETIGSLVLSICSRPLPIPSQEGAVPPGFDAWFASACARDVEERFSSARDAASELRGALDIDAAENEPPRRAPAPVRASKHVVVAEVPSPRAMAAADVPPAAARSAAIDAASTPSISTGVASSAAVTERTHAPARYRAIVLGMAMVALLGIGLLLARREGGDPESASATSAKPPSVAVPRSPSAAPAVASSTSLAPALPGAVGVAPLEPSGPARPEPPPAAAIVQAPQLPTPRPVVAPVLQAATATPPGTIGANARVPRAVRTKPVPSRVHRGDPIQPTPRTSRATPSADAASRPMNGESPGSTDPAAAGATPPPPLPPPALPSSPQRKPEPANRRSVNLGF